MIVDLKLREKVLEYTPGLLLILPAEVSACAVAVAEALTPGTAAAGRPQVRHRAPRPWSAAQSVGDHAPGGSTVT